MAEKKFLSPSSVLRFGVFQANLAARELYKHGVRIRLPGQPFCILSMLLEKPGEIVTREQMRQRLWASDTFVDFEHSLNSAIKKLRAALGDSPENSRYIETVPRVGYRFIAPVLSAGMSTEIPLASSPSNGDFLPLAASTGSKSEISNRIRRLGWWFALATFGLSAVLALLKYIFFPRSAPVLKQRDMVVLADFENSTGERVFDDALKQGLAVGLEQSPYFRLVSERKSAVILKQMGHPPDERLSGQTAIELCQRAGSKVMVQGAISTLGTIYVVGLTAIRCDNSDAIVHEQTEARSKEEVIGALGIAATRLRKRLGESIASIQKYSVPLEQATTTSLEALNAYGIAASTFDREGDRPALPLFTRAIELDPSFAMAYGQLASIYQNLGETRLAHENAIKAFQYKERLTESERIVIESWYNSFVTGDLEKAVQLYETEVQNYPPSPRVLNDLGATYGLLGHYEKAAAIFRQVLLMDPGGAATYGNLAASLLATGNFRDAGTILAEAQSQKLQTDYLLEVRYWKAFLDNDSKEMEVVLAQASNVPGARQLLLSEQARTEAYFGRFEKSRQLSELAARLMEHDGDKESAASCLAELAVREAEIGYGRKALSHVFHSLQLERSPAVVALATLALARIGDFERARNMAEELNKAHPSDTLIQKYWLPTIRARMELEQRKFSKALETLTIAGPFEFAAPPPLTVTTLYPAYVRGETYLAMGDGERADAEFGKLIDRPGMVLNFPLAALAPLERARAFALSGDRARAHDSYQRFFQLWNGADSDLPLLKQARAEFSKFTQNAASTSKP